MRLKTNMVISVIFLALLAFVYFYEMKGGEERQAEAERRKQLLDFSDQDARRISIVRAESTIVLEKRDEAWRLVQPIALGVDKSAVERYLTNLRETDVERVIGDSAVVTADSLLRAKYGLDEPRLRVHLELGEERSADTVAFGADSPMERFAYAQRLGENPEIFTVRAWRFDNMDKAVFDLRDRRVLAFEKDDVREIRLTRSDDTVVLVRSDEDEWRLEAPVVTGADESEVNRLLNRLRDAKARSFINESPDDGAICRYGLCVAIPYQVSLIVGEDRAEKRLSVGLEGDGHLYFARDASRPAVFTIDSTLVNQLRKPVARFRDTRPLRIDHREAVRRIEIYRQGVELATVERDTTGTWVMVSPTGREAKAWRWNSILTDLDAAEVEEFVLDWEEGEDADLSAYGLDDPRMRILVSDDGDTDMDVRLGNEAEGGGVYLSRKDVSSVYRVSTETLENLELGLDDLSKPVTEAVSAEADTEAVDAG